MDPLRIQKVPRRYSGLIMGALLSVVMGLIMSFVVTVLNLGLGHGFVRLWMLAFVATLPVGFPVSLLVTPLIKGFVDKISADQ